MAEVTEVKIKRRVLIQLGVPFFLLAGFVIAAIIFGTLYFTSELKGESNPHNVKELSNEAATVVADYVAELQGIAIKLDSEQNNENNVRDVLTSNRSLLAVSFFDESGIQQKEFHKSRTKSDLLDTLFNGSKNLQLLASEPSVLFMRTFEGENFVVLFVKGQNGFLSLGASIEKITTFFDSKTIVSPASLVIASKSTSEPYFVRNTLPPELEQNRPADSSLQRLLENDKSSYGYVTENSRRVDGHYEIIEGTNWIAIAETEASPVTGFSTSIFIGVAIVILIFILLLFYFISVFNKKIVVPLRKIEKSLHYFKTGDYTEPIEIDTENEFAAIAHQLNSMAGYIEGNTSERVGELKRALARQNTDTRLLIEKDVELREQGQKLKELDQAKSMFVSVAAHQMRTPLAAVKWAIKLVMDGDVGPVTPEQKEYLGKGYDSTTRMIGLINDLLDVDKIESDKFSYVMKEEKLDGILQSIVDELTPISIEKGVKLVYQKDGDAFSGIDADIVKLRNALQNLIDNAIKYTIGGGDVTVTLQEKDKTLYLSVTDSGIGIPLSEQSKVFGKFFRAKNAVRQETDGSGLGLYIVKKIIEKHGGNIRFESKENVGTTFYIEFPVFGTVTHSMPSAEQESGNNEPETNSEQLPQKKDKEDTN